MSGNPFADNIAHVPSDDDEPISNSLIDPSLPPVQSSAPPNARPAAPITAQPPQHSAPLTTPTVATTGSLGTKCGTCKGFGHRANNSRCPRYNEYLARKKKAKPAIHQDDKVKVEPDEQPSKKARVEPAASGSLGVSPNVGPQMPSVRALIVRFKDAGNIQAQANFIVAADPPDTYSLASFYFHRQYDAPQPVPLPPVRQPLAPRTNLNPANSQTVEAVLPIAKDSQLQNTSHNASSVHSITPATKPAGATFDAALADFLHALSIFWPDYKTSAYAAHLEHFLKFVISRGGFEVAFVRQGEVGIEVWEEAMTAAQGDYTKTYGQSLGLFQTNKINAFYSHLSDKRL